MSVVENRLGLGRRHCEEQRRYLAALEALAQRLRADERRLRTEPPLAGIAGQSVIAGNPAWKQAEALVERRAKLARSVAEIDAQIAEVGAALGVAERELQRREIASARHAANTGVSERRRARRLPRRPATPPIAGPEHGS